LCKAKRNHLNPYPKVVAELGPGDSLGIGLAALISGSEQYFAFDVFEHASIKKNEIIFDQLIELFKNRTPIPGDDVFPNVKPRLSDYHFPDEILDQNHMNEMLAPTRLAKIRASIQEFKRKDSVIQ